MNGDIHGVDATCISGAKAQLVALQSPLRVEGLFAWLTHRGCRRGLSPFGPPLFCNQSFYLLCGLTSGA